MSGSRQPTPFVNPYSGPTQPGAVGYIPSGTNYAQPAGSVAGRNPVAAYQAANVGKSVADVNNGGTGLITSMGKAAAGGAGGGLITGLLAGGAAGSVVPIVGNILGAVAGATIGGIFDAVQGNQNRKAMERQQREAREMAERQFAWGQNVDRFEMGIAGRQQNEMEKLNRHNITKENLAKLQDTLNNNIALRDKTLSLWGVK
jgi:hypothetical protein